MATTIYKAMSFNSEIPLIQGASTFSFKARFLSTELVAVLPDGI